MELWIRSEDKRILMKVNNIFLDANSDNKRICTTDINEIVELGTYETKERALEVLDEIQEFYQNNANNVGTDNYFYSVYEMPQE